MTSALIAFTASLCHEVNRAYCNAIGDASQVPWDEAPAWQKESAIKGVEFLLANPNADPSDMHRSWMETKLAEGWKYGPVKDPENKEHPCMVPYAELPESQRVKDHLFLAVCGAMQ